MTLLAPGPLPGSKQPSIGWPTAPSFDTAPLTFVHSFECNDLKVLTWTLIVHFTRLSLRLEWKYLLLGIITLLKNIPGRVFLLCVFPYFHSEAVCLFTLLCTLEQVNSWALHRGGAHCAVVCVRNDPESPELPVDRSNCTKLSFVLTFLLSRFPSLSLHSGYFSRSLSSSARGHMQRLCCWNELEKRLILHE